MIPQTFEQWKHCILYDCKIVLTREFVQKRLAVLEDTEHPETKKFVQLYGQQHLSNIISWFTIVLNTF